MHICDTRRREACVSGEDDIHAELLPWKRQAARVATESAKVQGEKGSVAAWAEALGGRDLEVRSAMLTALPTTNFAFPVF